MFPFCIVLLLSVLFDKLSDFSLVTTSKFIPLLDTIHAKINSES